LNVCLKDRKALEEALEEESDDDEEIDEKFLNLSGDDGAFFNLADILSRYLHGDV
jgi:hypothetical protein